VLSAGGSHRGIRISEAHLLGLAALASYPFDVDLIFGPVLAKDFAGVALDQALPAHVGPNERSVDVHDLCCRDLRFQAGLDRAFEDPAEPSVSPTLANTRKARMVGQLLVQSIADEPADRYVHGGLAHQLTVMNDAEKETGNHQSQSRLGVDPRPPFLFAIAIGDLVS